MQRRGRQSEFGSLRSRLRARKRRGVVVLEFIIAIPLLIILVLAVIEFALIFKVNQQVAAASKYGAKLASEISRFHADNPNLRNFNTASAPSNQSLKYRIDQFLQQQGLTASCGVRLEHNACGMLPLTPNQPYPVIANPSNCDCTPPNDPQVPNAVLPNGETEVAYVRVTVGLPLVESNVPDLLSYFGFSVENFVIQHTTTMRIEPNNTPPDIVVTGVLVSVPANHTPQNDMQNCDGTFQITNALGTTTNSHIVTIDFNGNGSSDLEQSSGLGYLWTVSAESPAPTPGGLPSNNGTTFNGIQFAVPNDPNTNGTTTEDEVTYSYTVTLTVTDSCSQSASCDIHVEITTRDSSPAP